MKKVLRLARREDLDRIMDLVAQGQAYFKSQGINQWQGGYPNREDILEDIARGDFYLLEEGDQVLGMAAIILGEDQFYKEIEGGAWLSPNQDNQAYASLHRIAIDNSRKGQGLAGLILEEAEKITRAQGGKSLRIDTHRDNRSMLRLIEKSGYTYCGLVYVADGGERVAYEKLLDI